MQGFILFPVPQPVLRHIASYTFFQIFFKSLFFHWFNLIPFTPLFVASTHHNGSQLLKFPTLLLLHPLLQQNTPCLSIPPRSLIILFNFFQIHYDATPDTISSSISAGLRHVVPHAGTVIQQCQNQFLVQYHFPALTAYPLICLNSALSIFSELCHLHYPVYICHHLQ